MRFFFIDPIKLRGGYTKKKENMRLIDELLLLASVEISNIGDNRHHGHGDVVDDGR